MRPIIDEQKQKGEGSFDELSFPVRINKLLAHLGVASRRAVDQLISDNSIYVNDKLINPGYMVQSGDKVVVDGKLIEFARPEPIYILLNKPKGFVTSASDELGRSTVLDLVDIPERIYPIGRLDKNTTGVLLLTNDGDLAYKLSHPKFEILKRYVAHIDRGLSKADMKELSKGIMLDDEQLAPCSIKLLDQAGKIVSIELHEGRYRQIRRMFEARDYRVIDLERTHYAGLTVGSLPVGTWRPLTKKEISILYELF